MYNKQPTDIPITFCKPDEWPIGEFIYLDTTMLPVEGGRWATRIKTGHTAPLCESLAVSVKYTGKPRYTPEFSKFGVRAKLTFLGDGERDTSTGCWICLENPYPLPAFKQLKEGQV